MSFAGDAKKIIKSRFISGLLTVVPIILTIILLKTFVEFVDGLLKPIFIRIFGQTFDFPLFGVLVAIALILLLGIFTANVIGRRLVRFWESLIYKIPVVRSIYGAAKQLVATVSVPNNKSFKSVVMIEYPRKGLYALGFLANKTTLVDKSGNRELLSIFIPSTPTPISGVVILVPSSEVVKLDMTIEEGIKFFVSGSIISPESLRPRIGDESTDENNKIDGLPVETSDETQ